MSYQCGQGHQTIQNETLRDPRISQLMRKKYIPLLKDSKKFLGNRLRKCKKKKDTTRFLAHSPRAKQRTA